MYRDIRDAALDLVEAQGLAATTIGHIASRVGISERTVFRYYASKEDALMPAQSGLVASMTEVKPAGVDAAGILADLVDAFRENFAFEVASGVFRRITRLLVKEPELMRFVARQERDLVEALGASLIELDQHPPARAMLLAEVATAVWRVAWQSFARDELAGITSSPMDHFDEAARELGQLFRPAG